MLRAPALKQGDTIGVISPASPAEMEKIHQAIPFFENMGLSVKQGRNLHRTYGYLAGTDEERTQDFHEMIEDKDVKAIIFARGGYGTARIASSLDYERIASNPKIIWGYSDITYLHTAIRQKTGLVTFHGPMLSSDIANPAFDSISANSFSQLFKPTPLQYDETIAPLEVINEGEATGRLIGGNLSLLTSTLSTPFEIDTKDSILLIEDIDEVPYRIDSMLNQLKLAGKLQEVRGVVVGDFANGEPKNKASLSLDEVIRFYLKNLGVPVMQGFKIGHCYPHFSVPLGVDATLNTAKKTLTLEAGVI